MACPVLRLKFRSVVRSMVSMRGVSLRPAGAACARDKDTCMRTAIGVDLGGSHTAAGVLTEDGTIHAQHELDLDDLSFDSVVDAVVQVVGLALADAGPNVSAIGVGSPGNVQAQTGTILYSPNFGWKDARSARRCARSSSSPSTSQTTRAAPRWESTRSVAGGARRTSSCLRSAPESAGVSSGKASSYSAAASAPAKSATIRFERIRVSRAPAARSVASRCRRRERD